MLIIKAFQIHFIQFGPRSNVFQYSRCGISIGNKSCVKSRFLCFTKNSHRPFSSNERLVICAYNDFGAEFNCLFNKFFWGGD